ncbi:G-protein coupled receptor Mth2-like isoform X5 [Photinus pyralis]|nr:G-protein coupled receptor Mth2-like isoform X5 [Photinus pyralis]
MNRVLLLLISIFASSVSPCPLPLTVDISNGEHFDNGTIVSGGISYGPNFQMLVDGKVRGCVCDIRRCVRKCCPVGRLMFGTRCQESDISFAPLVYGDHLLNVTNDHFYYIESNECPMGLYKLEPNEPEDEFFIQEDGRLYVPSQKAFFNPEDYCTDFFIDGEGPHYLSVLVCFKEDVDPDTTTYAYGMIISMPFLLLTFLVYAVLPDRNLHGKCLMCYVITLFGAYAFLVFIQLYPNDLAGANCKTLGILCFFFFTVSFFWMNVMSIDIWWAFSGLRGFSGSRKEAERKRFILYCGYAWGVSLLLTTIVIGFTVSENVEKNVWYNPGMGDGQCWFRDGVPTLLYFYVPMATIIVVNITLFAVTACKIKRVQQDTAMLRKDESKKHSYENDKQRFNLYLKLMLAMGVNWAMEIVSWIVDWQIGRVPPPVWYLTDFCNALYGVFVFFIFVFKRNIWKLLKRRYYMIMGKPHLARSMTQTAYSPRTTGSSLNHTVSTDKNFVTDSSVLTSEVS